MNAIPSRVTAAEFVRHFGEWQDRAAAGPIAITHHGRDRLVAMSATSYRALSRIVDGEPFGDTMIDATLVDRLGEGLVIFDRALRVVALSRIAAACLQVSEREVVAAGLTLEPAVRDELDRVVRSGEDAVVDVRGPGDDGRWLRWRAFPYRCGAACLIRDVTDERAARRRREDEAALAAAIGAHGRIGRARLSPRGTFLEVEPALAALAGYEPAALARTRLIDLLALDRRALAAGHLEDVLTGGPARAFESSLLARCGGQRPARIALSGSDDGAVALVSVD